MSNGPGDGDVGVTRDYASAAMKSGYDGAVQGCDGRRYVVDADARAYYDEILDALAQREGEGEDANAAEELRAIGDNALEGADGAECALAMDATCSRALERCARAASVDGVIGFLSRVCDVSASRGGGFYVCAKSLFGSRVLETAMGVLMTKYLSASDGGEGGGDVEEAAEKIRASGILDRMAEALAANAIDVAFDKRASPVARKLLGLLAGRREIGGQDATTASKSGGGANGRNAGKPSDGKSLADKLRGGTSTAGKFTGSMNSSYRFTEELRKFSDALLAAIEPELWNLTEDPCGSALLQATLKAHEGDDEALNWIIPGLLGCAPAEGTAEGEFLADAQEWDLKNLMQSRAGSHLVEQILAVAPKGLFNEIYRRFFRDKLISTAKHPVSNFVLQALLAATKSQDHVTASLNELSQVFGTLLHEKRSGVVAAMLAACARLNVGEKDAAKALARGLTLKMEARKEGRSQLAPALFWLDTPNYGRCSVLGSAMFQTLFKFQGDCVPMFSDSIVSMTDMEVLKVCQDSAGSRAVEAFLGAPAQKQKLKREFIGKLNGRWAQLGLSPVGSHVLEACFRESDARGKELILSGLAGQEGPLNATRHGPFLMRRLGVTAFKAAPEQWASKQKTAESMMNEFAKEFGEDEKKPSPVEAPASKKSKRSSSDDDEDNGDDAPAKKKDKKEKKEKKDKKEKKEKKEKKQNS